jgi:hypothetical protein
MMDIPGASLCRAAEAGQRLFRAAEAGRQIAGQGAMGEMIRQLEKRHRRWAEPAEQLPAPRPRGRRVHVYCTVNIHIETDE